MTKLQIPPGSTATILPAPLTAHAAGPAVAVFRVGLHPMSLLIAVSLLCLGGCARHWAAETSGEEALAQQIVQRLSVMEGVAAYKHLHKRPVEDRDREESLLDQMNAQGAALGIPRDVTRQFFRAQMEAAKIVQTERIQQWRSGEEAPPLKIPDLVADVRPLLDRLSTEMLQSLRIEWEAVEADASSLEARHERIERLIRMGGYSDAVVDAAMAGLPTYGRAM